jgi:hypothetical protein
MRALLMCQVDTDIKLAALDLIYYTRKLLTSSAPLGRDRRSAQLWTSLNGKADQLAALLGER